MLRAGTLDKLVDLQRREDVRSDSGGVTPTWVTVRRVWANVRYATGMEAVRSGVPVAQATASVRIRYRADLAQATTAAGRWRLLYRGLVHDIQSVLPSETSREFLDLVCTAGANNG